MDKRFGYKYFSQKKNKPLFKGLSLLSAILMLVSQVGLGSLLFMPSTAEALSVIVPKCAVGSVALLNGGFELPVITDAAGWDIYPSGTTDLGWTVNWAGIYDGAPATANLELQKVNTPAEGSQYAELDTDWGGPNDPLNGEPGSAVISQVVTVIPNATYQLSFKLSPRPGYGAADNNVRAQFGSIDQTNSLDGTGNTDAVWSNFSYPMTNDNSVTQTLSFTDLGTPNSLGMLIDDVRLEITSCPEPATATLTVIKRVVGGASAAGDFTMNITGNNVSLSSFPGSEAGTNVTLEAGDFSVTEMMPAESNYVSSTAGDCRGTAVAGQTYTCTITNTYKSAISGCVYNDADNNGVIDAGEAGLAAWTVKLIGCPYLASTTIEYLPVANIDETGSPLPGACTVMATTTTGGDGCYNFSGLSAGSFGVSLNVPAAWAQTLPANNKFYFFALEPGQSQANIDFAAYRLSICGDGIVNQLTEQCDDGNTNNSDGCSSLCQNELPITIRAYKVVCVNESKLPNWGNSTSSPAVITPEVINNFVSQSQGACQLADNWQFQYSYDPTIIPGGNHYGEAPYGTGWTPFSSLTASGNPAELIVNDANGRDINIREVLKDGYHMFSNSLSNNISAEIYCHDDIYIYDNHEVITAASSGSTYYCVAFNALTNPGPYCGDGSINQASEQCDDSNMVSGDGCSSTCQTESTDPVCGNGAKEGNEQCDGEAGVGAHQTCSNECTLINLPYCGDGIVNQTSEECDAGLAGSVTCSTTCQLLTCQAPKVYTLNADFDLGSYFNVVKSPADALSLDETVEPFGFIWVANSGEGTIVKINTDTGVIMGEYRTSPDGTYGNPSRTTVDKDGSVWVGNRNSVTNDYRAAITHVGLIENGQCEDRNGNGIIDTSTGNNDVKPWTDASGDRGVATAADECIVHYTPVAGSDARHISVDSQNNVWVSGINSRIFEYVKGGKYNVPGSGTILRTEPSVGYGGYGGLIDVNNVIWSANRLLRWNTANPLTGPSGGNWTGYEHDSYGLCIDPSGNVWNTGLYDGMIKKFAPDGTLIGTYPHGGSNAQGCAVDANGDVWVAHSLWGSTVGHLKNDGTYVGTITVGSGPSGVAVDAKGKVWVTNTNGPSAMRIDPALGPVGGGGVTVGAVDFTTEPIGNYLYNYSDMTGSTLSGKAENGTWSVIYNSDRTGKVWEQISWNGLTPGDSTLTVTAATSEDGITFGSEQNITNGGAIAGLTGKYIKVNVAFKRSSEGQSPILYDLTIGKSCVTESVCGDGVINGEETCDNGSANGQTCSPGCGSSCNYCSNSCALASVQGGSCGGGGGGGGGGGSIITGLTINNVNSASNLCGTALLTWSTSNFASSRVLYDLISHPDLSGLTAPNYGYGVSTDLDATPVTGHSVAINSLTPGTTYYFRPVSKDSTEEKVGSEVSLTVNDSCGEVLGEKITAAPEVLGEKIEPVETMVATGFNTSEFLVMLLAAFMLLGSSLFIKRFEKA